MVTLQTQSPVVPVMAANPTPAAPAVAAAPDAQPQDTLVRSHHEIDEKTFSWLDLGKGIAGSVVGGAIEGVGGAIAGLRHTPQITFEAVRGTWKSKMLGPILKTTLTPVIIAGGLLAPVLTCLGGLGYGIFEGFTSGAEKNPVAAGGTAIETCKKMHGKFTKDIVEGIREAATKEPSKPEDVYEIKIVEGVKGLGSSVTSAAVDGVGIGGTVALHLPQAYGRISKEIWKSDIALPLKVGGQFLATTAAVLAVPLGTVGGALYGIGKGAYNGYQHGFVEGTKMAGRDVAEVHNALTKLVSHN